jgi:enamine deaminase RidA (YjgF/YER057c/UK114 family)
VKSFCSISVAAVLLCSLAPGSLYAQKRKKPGSNDQGYIPVVAPENPKDKKKKDKEEEITQTPPPELELPLALTAETSRLTFAVSPLSSKGLLSQQIRDALNALLHGRHHGTIIQLRAFVAGSGDLRRVGELTGEIFSDKHEPLPVLSAVQVGGLPMQGAQVVIESTEVDRNAVNANGVAYFGAQAGASAAESIEKLKSQLAAASPGAKPGDVLRVTCFVSSLDQSAGISSRLATSFPKAAVDYVQMQREPVAPAAQCEMVVRLRALARPSAADSGPIAFVAAGPDSKLVITGTQLAFGSQESDLKLAFDRLEKTVNASNARLEHLVMSHLYVTPGAAGARMRSVEGRYASGPSTMLPVEGLPSLDAPFGVDVIALAER